MQGDKKKFIVLGVLALLIVCVGAFQFMQMGSPATPPAQAEKPKETSVEPAKEEVKNPLLVAALPVRDPFEPPAAAQEKKTPEIKPEPAPQPGPVGKMPPVEIGGSMPSAGFGGDVAPVVVPAPEFHMSYTLSGTMLGSKPLAIFSDVSGNQRIVPIGGSIDADTTVLDVQKRTVTVKFHGKTLRLTVEGNPNDK